MPSHTFFSAETPFDDFLRLHPDCRAIADAACQLHQSVNQTYGKDNRPYGYHLTQVAEAVMRYGRELVQDIPGEVPVLLFAAYFHDSIEDARLTYHDVRRRAEHFMDTPAALLASEIVYALTNEKGRTRAERANENYYAGIRATPFAPFVKLCDRYANMTYSLSVCPEGDTHMREVYLREWPHFLQSITVKNATDRRLRLSRRLLADTELLLSSASPSPTPH